MTSFASLPLKRIAQIRLGKMLQPEARSELDTAAPYLRAAHVQPQGRLVEVGEQTMWFSPQELREHDLRAGDVVVVEGGAGFGRPAVLTSDRAGWGFQNSIVRLRAFEGVADGRFINYALQSALAAGAVEVACNSATIPHFTADKVGAFTVPSPPVDHQRAIADFLDRETAQIDTLIAKQLQLIEGLRERRFAEITHAVEGGVPNSRKKTYCGDESRVEQPLKYTIDYREGPGIMAEDFRLEGIPLLRVSSVRERRATLAGCNFLDPTTVAQRWSQFRVRMGDLLISASASMGTVSEVASDDLVGAVPYTGIIRIRPRTMTAGFIRWYFISGPFLTQIDALKAGSTIQHFGPSHLGQMRVSLPSYQEQASIVAYLDKQTTKIDTLITKAERFIAVAKERRAALITAAVTGQIALLKVA